MISNDYLSETSYGGNWGAEQPDEQQVVAAFAEFVAAVGERWTSFYVGRTKGAGDGTWYWHGLSRNPQPPTP